jgi:hypothetical protein
VTTYLAELRSSGQNCTFPKRRSNALPTWLVVTIDIAIWGGIYLIGIGFARTPFRKDEKALAGPVRFTWRKPDAHSGRCLTPKNQRAYPHVAQTMLTLTALFASLAILLSLRKEHSGSPPPENG